MEGRYNRCRLALLVAPGGFAEPVRNLQLQKSEKDMLIVLVGASELDDLIRRKDRNEALKEMHRRAVSVAFDRRNNDETSPER